MPYLGKDAIQINRIRMAGLGKVRAAALQDGLTEERVARDVAILRAVANGNPSSAAAKCCVAKKTIWRVLRRYENYANQIMAERK